MRKLMNTKKTTGMLLASVILIIVAMLAIMPISNAANTNDQIVSANAARVKKSTYILKNASKKAKKIKKVSKNKQVKVYSKWEYVKYTYKGKSYQGYVPKSKRVGTYIRKTPSNSGKKVIKIKKEGKVKVLSKWTQISYGKTKGWVQSNILKYPTKIYGNYVFADYIAYDRPMTAGSSSHCWIQIGREVYFACSKDYNKKLSKMGPIIVAGDTLISENDEDGYCYVVEDGECVKLLDLLNRIYGK